MRTFPIPNLMLRIACGWLAALACSSALAASVEVQVVGSDGKPLPDAVVFLESPAAQAASKPVVGTEVKQAARRFTQRVSVVTVGSEVRFPNHDTVRHQVYSFSPAKTFELKLYAGTPSSPVLFDKPGIAVLGCNIHDAMVAWIVIVETPYHGLADAQGVVRLANVPVGTFHLRTWHPGLAPGAPALDQVLAVPAGGSKLSVKLPLMAAQVS